MEARENAERFDLYRDMAERTDGEIYIGVVGPVRTGKSTFITRFMEQMVLPLQSDPYKRARAMDAHPRERFRQDDHDHAAKVCAR